MEKSPQKQTICTRSVLDTTVPGIRFDEKGVCQYCKVYDLMALEFPLNSDSKTQFTKLIEKIKSTLPNPALIRPATESLADLLEEVPVDPDFDLETWTTEWNAVESEMKAIDWANDIVEGRG